MPRQISAVYTETRSSSVGVDHHRHFQSDGHGMPCPYKEFVVARSAVSRSPERSEGDEAISAARKTEKLNKNLLVAFLKYLNRELLLSDEKQERLENEIASPGSQRRQNPTSQGFFTSTRETQPYKSKNKSILSRFSLDKNR